MAGAGPELFPEERRICVADEVARGLNQVVGEGGEVAFDNG